MHIESTRPSHPHLTVLPCSDESVAHGFDALGPQQEVIVDEVDPAVAAFLQMLHLGGDVLRAAAAPLTLVEHRDIAEDAWPGAAAGSLHGGIALHRQHRRHVERHRLDVVERQALTIGKRPLIEIALDRTIDVVPYGAVRLGPGQAGDGVRFGEALEQIEDQLLAVAAANVVDLGALRLHSLGVQGGEDAAESELRVTARGPDLARQNLGIRVGGGRQEAQAHQVRLQALDLLDDVLVGSVGIGLIEHVALVAFPFEHGRQRHDADRRKADDLRHPPRRQLLGGIGIKLRIANVDQ